MIRIPKIRSQVEILPLSSCIQEKMLSALSKIIVPLENLCMNMQMLQKDIRGTL